MQVLEQGLPGVVQLSEDESERRGLPDLWIHDDEQWSLVVESKISARFDHEQIRRHKRTAERCGFNTVVVLARVAKRPAKKLLNGVRVREWREVYEWLCRSPSEWANRVARYFEIAEAKLSDEGYLTEGTLTVFSGIPFGEDEPYSYPEAKRLLRLAMTELRTRNDLISKLGMDPQLIGRTAITGRDGTGVWDFLRLRISNEAETFTRYPHLTLSFESDRLLAYVTVPDGVKSRFRRNLVGSGYDKFRDEFARVVHAIETALNNCAGAAPWVNLVQRRFPNGMRSPPVYDARIEFDPRTAIPSGSRPLIGIQDQWLKSAFEALAAKKSNLQMAFGAVFPYRTCTATRSRLILDSCAATWIACEPLLRVMLEDAR